MTDAEKAKEIADFLYYKLSHIDYSTLKRELLEMARFAEEQMIEKACEWLKDNIIGMMDGDLPYIQSTYDVSKNEFIEDFKKAMEE